MLGRLFKLEPAAVGSAALAVYAAARMLYGAFVAHDVALDGDVLVAGAAALWGIYTRIRVTPTADPKTADKVRLVPVDQTPRHGRM